MPKRALVIYGKAPIPGTVKTRLCPPLEPEEATALHSSFLIDSIERAKKVSRVIKTDCFLACHPDTKHPFFKALQSQHSVKLLEQRGNTLGEKMNSTMNELFARSFDSVVITGCDIPTLPAEEICHAFQLLDKHDCIIGPCPDGGYYLIGLKFPCEDIFMNIPWSTPEVLSLTKHQAISINLNLSYTNSWPDIDTINDLIDLGKTANQKSLSQRTAKLLKTLSHRLKDTGKPL